MLRRADMCSESWFKFQSVKAAASKLELTALLSIRTVWVNSSLGLQQLKTDLQEESPSGRFAQGCDGKQAQSDTEAQRVRDPSSDPSTQLSQREAHQVRAGDGAAITVVSGSARAFDTAEPSHRNREEGWEGPRCISCIHVGPFQRWPLALILDSIFCRLWTSDTASFPCPIGSEQRWRQPGTQSMCPVPSLPPLLAQFPALMLWDCT